MTSQLIPAEGTEAMAVVSRLDLGDGTRGFLIDFLGPDGEPDGPDGIAFDAAGLWLALAGFANPDGSGPLPAAQARAGGLPAAPRGSGAC
jgi:hypothetical protein